MDFRYRHTESKMLQLAISMLSNMARDVRTKSLI